MLTISGLLGYHARYRGQYPALEIEDQSWNFESLNSEANGLANALIASGLKKGDRFATVLPNCFELVVAYCAAAVSGLVIVPCSPLLQQSGLKTLLQDSGSRLVIADQDSIGMVKSICQVLAETDSGKITLISAQQHAGIKHGEFTSYNDFTRDVTDTDPMVEIHGSDIFNIMYSSGTTGEPKGIIHSHQIRSMYATLFASSWRMTPESVVLHAGSLVFNGAMLLLMPWLFLGCRFILHRSFNAEQVIEEVEKVRVTHLVMVPAQIIAILNSPAFSPQALSSLEMLQNVGAPLHLNYKKMINQQLPGCFYELYGVTEGFMTILDKTEAIHKEGSVGKPASFTRITILDDAGNPCACDEIGEICGKGPLVMPGYHNRPELSNQAFTGGWLRSGDLGYLDKDGYLFLVDRKKDMIISGGVNVYPKDIEEIVIRHPAVDEVAVFGVEHDKWGEAAVAAVRINRSIEPDTLVRWVNKRVDARYQRIVNVIILDQFPRNAAAKILKRELRDSYHNFILQNEQKIE